MCIIAKSQTHLDLIHNNPIFFNLYNALLSSCLAITKIVNSRTLSNFISEDTKQECSTKFVEMIGVERIFRLQFARDYLRNEKINDEMIPGLFIAEEESSLARSEIPSILHAIFRNHPEAFLNESVLNQMKLLELCNHIAQDILPIPDDENQVFEINDVGELIEELLNNHRLSTELRYAMLEKMHQIDFNDPNRTKAVIAAFQDQIKAYRVEYKLNTEQKNAWISNCSIM